MSASQFPGFVFKEKGLSWQAGNYQLLTPANAETDADLHPTSEKNQESICTTAVQTLPHLL